MSVPHSTKLVEPALRKSLPSVRSLLEGLRDPSPPVGILHNRIRPHDPSEFPMHVRHWHLVIGGFLQTEGQGSLNGTMILWNRLHSKYAQADTVVEWHAWSADVDALAEKVVQFSVEGLPKIYLYAYSWGATTAIRLARAFRRRGYTVHILCLCDGVYRHWYYLGQWRALVPGSRLQIPENVEEVYWYYQTRPRFSLMRKMLGGPLFSPAGHKPQPLSKNTRIHPGIRLYHDHTHMDNSAEWQTSALLAAERHQHVSVRRSEDTPGTPLI